MKHQPHTAKDRRAGFSLAELMVVIVILGLIATLVVPNVIDRFQWAKRQTAKIDIRQLEQATEEYLILEGAYPDELAELVVPNAQGVAVLEHSLKDPWKTDYAYAPPHPGEPREWIASYAADKLPGGEGWDADIDNWTMDEE